MAINFKKDFIKALEFKAVKPVPYSVKFTVEALEKYISHTGRKFDPVLDTGSYVVASHTNNGWDEVKPGFFRDYFKVVWNRTIDKTLGIAENPPLQNASFAGYTFPLADDLPVYRFIEENNKRYPGHFHMLSIGFALFERAWSLVGMENLFVYFLTEPAFVHALMEKITTYNTDVIRKAATFGGIDCIHLGDDWGTQTGLILGKELWQEFIKPYFKRTCDAAKEESLYVSLHSCGNVEELIPEMIECGVDVFDPFQPEVMDISKVYDTYRHKIAFWGGLSVQHTLPFGTVADVRNETKALLAKFSGGGGYILSPSHSLTGDIPVENINAFLDIAKNQFAS